MSAQAGRREDGSAISGRENYARAIEFRSPAYLPVHLVLDLDWLQEKDPAKRERIRALQALFPDDLLGWLGAWRNATEPVAGADGAKRWTDEWGVGWTSKDLGGHPISHPLADGYHRLAEYRFPDPRLPGRFTEDDAKLAQRGDRYVQSRVWFTLFERLWLLRGFENMLMDPYEHEADFLRLRDRIIEIDLEMIDLWLARGVDGIFFSDDWGTQRGLLMRPEDWRRWYLPCYRRLFRRVRDGGAHVWFHSCGNVLEIVGDLLDAGLQVLNPVQSNALDVRELARRFGGRLCFFGGVNVQETLIRGTPEDVRREVREMIALLGERGGGYIGGTSNLAGIPETPLDNIIALYEAFAERR